MQTKNVIIIHMQMASGASNRQHKHAYFVHPFEKAKITFAAECDFQTSLNASANRISSYFPFIVSNTYIWKKTCSSCQSDEVVGWGQYDARIQLVTSKYAFSLRSWALSLCSLNLNGYHSRGYHTVKIIRMLNNVSIFQVSSARLSNREMGTSFRIAPDVGLKYLHCWILTRVSVFLRILVFSYPVMNYPIYIVTAEAEYEANFLEEHLTQWHKPYMCTAQGL